MTALLAAALNLLLQDGNSTYTIRDGGRVVILTTAEEEPIHILEEAGISLGEEDRFVLTRESGRLVLQVLRQQKITVDHYDRLTEVTSYGETVAQLLERLGIVLTERDELSCELEAETFDGMTLRIFRKITQEQTYTVTLPPEIQYCRDPSLPLGTEKVLIEGRCGELLRSAEVTYINGREMNRKILREEVITHPMMGIVAIGTGSIPQKQGENLPLIGNGLIRLPTGEVLTYSKVISSLATAYCDKGLTATGTQARVGAIAVDPKYIPYGTRMFILSKDGSYIYGIATAEDCGSKEHIYGTRIDLHYDTREECIQFGARMCWVYFLS